MISTPIDSSLVRGVAQLEKTTRGVRPHRLPDWLRQQFPDPQLLMTESQPAGVRLAFQTTARTIELITHPTRVGYRGLPRPRGSIDLVIAGEPRATQQLGGGDLIEIDPQTGTRDVHTGPPHTTRFVDLPGGSNEIELWLPHNEAIELIELRSDEPVHPVSSTARRWVHHGSSISQGSNASSPSRTWPGVAARLGGVDVYNLGLGGSAIVDAFTARVIRNSDADLISVKLGINVVNLDAMRLRAFVPAVHGFLDTIRDGHPDTPIILISPIFCPIQENTPGPVAIDVEALATGSIRFLATGRSPDNDPGRLTLQAIRTALAGVAQVRAADANLHYLDGTALYGPSDEIELPLPDALHPDTATHDLIGHRFAEYAFGQDGPFARR